MAKKTKKTKKTKKALAHNPVLALENFEIFRSAMEQTADHVVITDVEGTILYVNPAFVKTTGYTSEEAIGNTPRILKSGRYNDEFYRDLWQHILSGKTFQGTIANKTKEGSIYYSDQTITPVLDSKGRITHFVSIWKDITERIKARDEFTDLAARLKYEKLKLEKILNFGEKIETMHNLNNLIDFVVNQTASILESERCSLMLFDENKGELTIRGAVGLDDEVIMKSKKSVGEGVAGLVVHEGKPLLVKVIDEDERFQGQEYGNANYRTKSFLSAPIKTDHKLIGVINVTDKFDKGGDTAYSQLDLKILLTIVRQVATALENAQLSKELKYLTITDPLTTLYNHRYLMESLAYEIRRFQRFKRPLTLMKADIDDFKSFNDEYGHKEGDRALRLVADILKSSLREVDIICRYSGDDFIVILPETTVEETIRLAKNIQKNIKKKIKEHQITMSIGIAKCTENINRHDFILKVYSNLKQAKDKGGDLVYCQDKKE